MGFFYYDSETFLTAPGCQAPRLVCTQYAVDDGPVRVTLPAFQVLECALKEHTWVAHNAAFDMAVLGANAPDLLPLIFRAYDEDRVLCTMERMRLGDLADLGHTSNQYSLEACCNRYGIATDKGNPWRMRYGTLVDVPPTNWPHDAYEYAAMDITALRELYQTQPDVKDVAAQSRAQFMLYLCSAWGLCTDQDQVERFAVQTQGEIDKAKETLLEVGLVRPSGTRDTKAAKSWMADVHLQRGTAPKLTNKGQVSTDEDACRQVDDPIMNAYHTYSTATKSLERVNRLRHPVIQPRYITLLETGRTSCRGHKHKKGQYVGAYGDAVQTYPRKPGIRECYVPRPGYLFCSADYSGFELATWAQCCLWAVGHSTLADALNEGRDVHTEMGARIADISVEQAYREGRAWRKHYRQAAKGANFGLPGGMGKNTFQEYLRVQFGMHMDLHEASRIRDLWYRERREARAWFRWVKRQMRGQKIDVVQFISERKRANCYFTAASNSYFQGLAADAAKAAGWQLAKECYVVPESPLFGSRIVGFFHDEYMLEVPEFRAHEAATRQCEVMVSAAKRYVPDVRISVEPALMRRWSKSAEETRDAEGRLIPWD